MFKNISLQAKNSLLQLGKTTIKPTCQELTSLKVSRNFLTHELPIRYIHLIKLLSVNGLNTLLSRVLEDVDILQKATLQKSSKDIWNQEKIDRETINTLSKRMQETLSILNKMSLDKKLLSQIYTFELSVKLLLEEWEGLCHSSKKDLVQDLDFVKVAEEAARHSRQPSQTITITSASGKPIKTPYIKHHLLYMLSELIKSQASQDHLNIIVSEGKEDICFRITNDHISPATKPLLSLEYPTSRFVQSMARYWGGEMETVRMGNLVSTYLHIKKKGGREHIPPVMESVPHGWIETLLISK